MLEYSKQAPCSYVALSNRLQLATDLQDRTVQIWLWKTYVASSSTSLENHKTTNGWLVHIALVRSHSKETWLHNISPVFCSATLQHQGVVCIPPSLLVSELPPCNLCCLFINHFITKNCLLLKASWHKMQRQMRHHWQSSKSSWYPVGWLRNKRHEFQGTKLSFCFLMQVIILWCEVSSIFQWCRCDHHCSIKWVCNLASQHTEEIWEYSLHTLR